MEQETLEQLLDTMTPETLAKLCVAVSSVMGPNEDFPFVLKLSNRIFDAGVRNCGEEFITEFFSMQIKD